MMLGQAKWGDAPWHDTIDPDLLVKGDCLCPGQPQHSCLGACVALRKPHETVSSGYNLCW